MHEASLKYGHELVREEICCFSVFPQFQLVRKHVRVRGRASGGGETFDLLKFVVLPSLAFFQITTEKEFSDQLQSHL